MGKMGLWHNTQILCQYHIQKKKDRSIVKMVAPSCTGSMVKKCRNTTINRVHYPEDALKFPCGNECQKACSLGVSVKVKEGCWNGQKHRVWMGERTGVGYV